MFKKKIKRTFFKKNMDFLHAPLECVEISFIIDEKTIYMKKYKRVIVGVLIINVHQIKLIIKYLYFKIKNIILTNISYNPPV